MAQIHLLIVCGEPSGDLNAALLAQAIRKINPEIKISAVGGAFLRQAHAEVIYDIKDLSVLGFFDALKKLPAFFALKKLLLEKIKKEKLDAVILVDFSGFNLRLAKAINKALPVIYYTSPQVWASRGGRIQAIKKYVAKIIVFFKFEETLYKKYGIDVSCCGYPLLDVVQPAMTKEEFIKKYNLYPAKTTLALLPGSRSAEIKNILPLMLKACQLIRRKISDTQFLIAKSTQVDWEIYRRITKAIPLDLKIIEGKIYDCLNAADFALVASGTATLETAILEKPFLVIYKMGLLNYLLYRPQIKIPHIGMVNIVAEKKIIPEFIQFGATPKKIASAALKILDDAEQLAEIKNNLSRVKSLLGEKGASSRAAQIILDYLK